MSLHTTATAAIVAASAIALSAPAIADGEEHLDVWLSLGGDGRLVVGGITEPDAGEPEFFPGLRVFEGELGEDPAFPFSGDEPGFEMEDGTVAPGTPFTFLLDGPVTRWNGAGYEPTTARLLLAFGPSSVVSGDGFTSGFSFNADAAGGFHNHLELTLLGDGGADPEPGLYLVPMKVAILGTDSGTETFFWTLNLGMDEAMHEAATEWVGANRVAEPCRADVDGDGAVGFGDLLEVLSAWGACL